MKKYMMTSMAIILSILMCVQMFPFQVIASNTGQAMTGGITQNESTDLAEESNIEEAYVLHEVDEYRATNTKHYRMSDGSYTAAEFPNAVHYENDNNEFVDIDNTITLGEEGYVNTDNKNEYVFSDEYDDTALLTFGYDEYEISMDYIEPIENVEISEGIQAMPEQEVSDRHIEITNPGAETYTVGSGNDSIMTSETDRETTDTAIEEKLSVEEYIRRNDKSTSSIKYVNISDGVDLRYDLIGDSLKEYIVLKEKPDTNKFSFGMSFNALIPILNEDKSVNIVNNKGESIFIIPAPYMTDDAGAVSYDCEYTLTQTPVGYVLDVTVDEEWLNDEERVYPVMVDPTVSISRKDNSYNTNITTEYYSVAQNRLYQAGTGDIFMGYDSSGEGVYRTYIRINTLPTLPVNTIPVNSRVYLAQKSYDSVGMNTLTVSAREATSTSQWYNNYSSTLLDTTILSSDTNMSYVYWDVTKAAKKWYASNNADNYGIAFISEHNFTNTSCAKAKICGYSSATQINGQPIFTVKYIHTVGIEDSFTYLTQGAGDAGVGYIRVNDGALSAQRTDVYYDSVTMPVSISHVYNKVYSNVHFTGTYVHNGTTYNMPFNTCNYTQMYVGRGWKLDLQQTIIDKNIENTDNTVAAYKIYTDADGTENYFLLDESAELDSGDPEGTKIYVDEDGKGLKIKDIGNTENKLYNDQDTVYSFKNGYLYKIEDANGNYIRIYYGNASSGSMVGDGMPNVDRNRIVKVAQKNVGESAEKTIATLHYDSQSRLVSITDHEGRSITYSYAGETHLYSATEADGGVSRYYYDAEHNYRMTAIYDSQIGYGVRYIYDDNSVIESFIEYCVEASVEQTGAEYFLETTGNGVSYVTYIGADRTVDTEDDVITTYLFDNYGRTVNCYSSNQKMDDDATGSFRIYGSAATAYMPEQLANVRTKNHIINSAQTGGVANNLIYNPGAENGKTSWSNGTVSTEEKHNGGHSFKISGAKQFTQTRQLTVGTYTLSAYVKVTSAASDTQVYLKWGTKTSRVLRETTPDGRWERLSVTFNVVMPGNSLMILQTKGASTVVYADDFQLEVGEGTSRLNLLDNGNMEYWGGNWTPRVSSTADFTTETSLPGGNHSLKLSGTGMRNVMENTVPLTGVKAGESFVLSGWAKAASIPVNDSYVNAELGMVIPEGEETPDYKPQSRFKLYAKVEFTDGSTPQWFQNNFNPDITAQWQFLSIMIVPLKDVSSITVGVCYGNNNGYAYFDNLSLIREDVATYRYDGEGYYESVTTSTSNEPENYSFNAGNLITATCPGQGTYNYTYQTSGNTHLATSVTNDVLKTVFEYNTAGQNTKSTLMNKNDETLPKIESTAEYTANRDHVSKLTDSSGISTSYSYNSKNQLTRTTAQSSDTTDGSNVSVVETYDSAGRNISSYISGTVSLAYKYSNGRLEWIERGGYITSGGTKQEQAYSFEYDCWGNTTVNKIGYIDKKGTSATTDDVFVGSPLATYTYEQGNGNVSKMEYSTGYSVEYDYDVVGRIKTEAYLNSADTELYRDVYYYNGDGSLSRKEKIVDNTVTNTIYYSYDGIGRIIEVSEYEGNTLVDRQSYGYDDINRNNKTEVQGGENSVTTTLTYDEADGKLLQLTNGYSAAGLSRTQRYDYTYDHLNRVSTKKLTHYYAYLKATYGYASNLNNSSLTSTLVNSIDYTATGVSGTMYSFDYTYDRVGNIKSVASDGTSNYKEGSVTYYYDKQNQLVMEDNSVEGKTYLYEYDSYGNIRKKYSINSAGFDSYQSAVNDIPFIDNYTVDTYTYGNDQWKDQLTAYNGVNITYDSLGNPLDYNNGTEYDFTWENGRRLAHVSNNIAEICYEYDSDGKRIYKRVDDYSEEITQTDEYSYYYAGDSLISQVWDDGAQSLNFLYDEGGSIYGFIYDDGTSVTPYFYIKNLQGDVVAIMDEDGDICATYTYDAWGNILGITDYAGFDISADTDEVGYINPIRYRGYYYDNETGFYYLQSRYYDPVVGRFLNADGYISTGLGMGGFNMFSYCNNNPIVFKDNLGFRPILSMSTGNETAYERRLACDYMRSDYSKPMPTSTSDSGIEFITSYEQYSSEVYLDAYGNPTIGYGHLIKDNESFSSMSISEALSLFKSDLSYFEKIVFRYMMSNNIRWNQNQFDAMVSVAFNSGQNGFYNIADKIIVGWDVENSFTCVYTREKAKNYGGVYLGLWRRRMDEFEIYMYASYEREDRMP